MSQKTVSQKTVNQKMLSLVTPTKPWRQPVARWLVVLMLVPLLGLLTACALPQVSAEDRLFLKLSVEFLDEYQLPKLDFENTRVGGLSAIAYDRQRDRLYALSDDRSEFAPARFYTLKLSLDGAPAQKTSPKKPDPQKTSAPAIGIKQIAVESVTFLTDENGKPYAKGAIDPEGLAISPLRSVFVSSEGVTHDGIAPFVREFDQKTGQWQHSLPIPARYIPEGSGAEQKRGVRDNLGFEALTLNPFGYGKANSEPFRLFTATESSLAQDNDPTVPPRSRLLHYLLEEGRALLLAEHLYPLDPPPEGALNQGLTELLAIDQGGHFLSLERTFGAGGFEAKLFQMTTGGATDISAIASLKGLLKGVEPIRKRLLLDFSQLKITQDNLEGMTLGPRLPDGSQSLLLVSDDNFRQEQVTQFLLFRIKGIA